MTAEEPARVLGRDGNAAVVHLPGRAYPGVHLQGDTFAALHGVLGDAAARLRRSADDGEALDELDAAVADMTLVLEFYEQVLAAEGTRLPYHRGRGKV